MILPWNRQDIPICAGVLILSESKVLLTLATLKKWIVIRDELLIPVTGVSGGQEIGESMIACASREAREEISCNVKLHHSPITYVERDPDLIQIEQFNKAPAPIIYQVQPRTSSEPYAPGLPCGDRLHIGIFRATFDAKPQPGDIPGLLWIPLTVLPLLAKGLAISQLADLNIELNSLLTIPKNAHIFIPMYSTEGLLIRIIQHFGVTAITNSSVH